jgi:hypothetical protein
MPACIIASTPLPAVLLPEHVPEHQAAQETGGLPLYGERLIAETEADEPLIKVV